MKTTSQTWSRDIPSYVFQKSFFGREIQEQAEQTSKDKRVYYMFLLNGTSARRQFKVYKKLVVQTFGKLTLSSSGCSNSIALYSILKLPMC